ncbi:MAG: CARDB domain-containing protein, partial [Planctomycetota bacterium]
MTKDATWSNIIPYHIIQSLTIQGADGADSVTTLTIEPGAEVRFNANVQMTVGAYSGDPGALIANGTETDPVVFTSTGSWYGIQFIPTASDSSILNYCVIENVSYPNGAIYLYQASPTITNSTIQNITGPGISISSGSPTIQYNTIRNSSHSGIYVAGTGSNNAVIHCNNLKDNLYGVYLTSSAQPQIHNNNFLNNQNYGIYNQSTGITVDAESNWWGDLNGPNTSGDNVYGDVDYIPWLTQESDCVTAPPTNLPPNTPTNPNPEHGAVNVELVSGTLDTNWVGGDPNPWDMVTYDIYLGTVSDNLSQVGDDINSPNFQLTGLSESTTYYWQVIAHDDEALETSGPIWQFTTQGPSPDLTITDITLDPADNIEAGQVITFTATIQNAGAGPAVDIFYVKFKIDGNSIGSQAISPIVESGASVQASQNWTAQYGDHTIEVIADSTTVITESDESNNALSEPLPAINDTVPPALINSSPADGAVLQEVSNIVITLQDANGGIVNDTEVINSFVVLDGNNQPISGSITENNDVFTFVPNISPLPDNTYTVSFTAIDMAGNAQAYSLSFIVDNLPPSSFTITGGTVYSGAIQARPVQNQSNTANITLTGTRDDNTSVWVNNVQRVSSGSGDWTMNIGLSQGDNALEVWLQDAANNRSVSVWVDILVDSVAPAVTSVIPANDSFLNTPPATVLINYQEATSGLNMSTTTHSIKDSSQTGVAGNWTESGGNQLIFTPSSAFVESEYTVDVQLKDNLSNQGTASQYQFTVDTTPPPAPQIDPVTSPTHTMNQTITGTKEAYASILLDGQQVVDHTQETTWQHTVTLQSGTNTFSFTAQDRAENQSPSESVEIIFDDIPPTAVTTLTVNGQGNGTTIILNWTGYDESAHGDIDYYRIYLESAPFTDVSGLTVFATESAGAFTHTVPNLTKGNTYYFAVVAVDLMGNALNSVTSVSGVPSDIFPPPDVTNLSVQSFETGLIFTWTHSAGSDLAGYKVYFDNDTQGVLLPATQNTYEKTGLNSSTGYPCKVSAIDEDENESSGITITGVTWLDNPTGLSTTPYSGYVDLSWSGATPSQYVKHYRVYVSDTDFTTVQGMSPNRIATGASAKITGLTDNTTYYFAVTTINTSDGERKQVSTVSETPMPDELGPEVIDVQMDGAPLTDGQTLNKPVTFTLNASDPAGVSRVEFLIDGNLVHTDYNGTPNYSWYWNIVSATDGPHTISIVVYDTLGNSTTLSYNLTIALVLPAAPNITQPLTGLITNQTSITVSGSAEKHAEVLIYLNTIQTGASISVDEQGNFSTSLTLVEGENRIQAAAQNRAGIGPLSAEVMVTLDTTIPQAPANLTAQSKEGGQIRLAWQVPADTVASGYNVYRSDSSFVNITSATQVNTQPVTQNSYIDLPPSENTWFYRVTTVDKADNESDGSNEVSAISDNTMPRATSINYYPQGNYDPGTGRMGPGQVDLELIVSEPLQTIPFMSITPEGGAPISIDLMQQDETTYTGFFFIEETTPTATAYALFSGRDLVGNRGTEIDAGATINIDTDGPAIIRIDLQPQSPIQNDEQNPVAISVTIGLDDEVKPGTGPELSYLLSGPGSEVAVIANLTQISTQNDDVQTWQGSFTLPADAGLTEAETLHLVYQAIDDLDNISTQISAPNAFQVYQGDLPPLEAPEGLTAQAQSGGKIRLAWNEVEMAVAYQLYRQAPLESDLTPYQRLEGVLEYIDQTTEDGLYRYAISSIRQENNQESESGFSNIVEVTSDAQPPNAPQTLGLELIPQGILAQWEAPAGESVSYFLYRADTTEITSVDGLTPLITGIQQTTVIDPNPSLTEHCYVVTAVDEAGNESLPSNSVYLNVGLLPVSSLHVEQMDNDLPVISWSHPNNGNLAGYDIYLGQDNQGVKLNDGHLTDLSYTDTGYTNNERQYAIIAVDNNEEQSLSRTILLPNMKATRASDEPIKRGVMNRLEYVVENLSSQAIDNARLHVLLNDIAHISEPFNISSGETKTIPVIVGGYEDLEDFEPLTTTIEITPNRGEQVEITRTSEIQINDGMLVLQILNEEFIRGGSGEVRFTLENTGEEAIEIVTAKNGGTAPSDEITFYLLDEDENILTSLPFKQNVGNDVITISNRNTIARIPAGEIFTSQSLDIPVPPNPPDNIIVRMEIENLYYHQGQDEEVIMNGLATTHEVTLVETSYLGEILAVEPQSSRGNENIIITGRAVDRETNDPLPNAALNLIISLDGFERTFEVLTDENGIFTYTFTPMKGEGGIYQVMALHPELLDRPNQAQFAINRLDISPSVIRLNIPKNYEQTITLQVHTSDGTDATNLQVTWEAIDQQDAVFPEGVHFTPNDPITLGSGETGSLTFRIWADNTALDMGTFLFKIKSDETQNEPWGTVLINAEFSEANPFLNVTPTHIETGVALGEIITETIVLENKGLADLEDTNISLINPDGTDAPNWVFLNSSDDLGTLGIGEEKEVSLSFAPPTSILENIYTFYLRITSSNYPTTDIGLYVSVTQSGIGSVLFKVKDIYTGTVNANNELIYGLSGAKVKLQNEKVLTEVYEQTTDDLGEVLFSNLPTGIYKYRITADNHQEKIGRLWIKAGVTVTEDLFLTYNLVTIEWEVVETTIEDEYVIVLSVTYETDVPAPVVVLEPASAQLPDLKAGDVFNGEFTLTNYGLIRADNLKINLPQDDQFIHYELLQGIPDSIGAKERLTVSYRLTCLQSLDQDEETGTGGANGSYSACMSASYHGVCSNGCPYSGNPPHCFYRSSPGGSYVGGTGGPIYSGGGGGSPGGYVPLGGGSGGSTTSGGGSTCVPEPDDDDGQSHCPFSKCPTDEDQDKCHNAGSWVNPLHRIYNDRETDLSVKVPGGTISIERYYYKERWYFKHWQNKIELVNRGSDNPNVQEIDSVKRHEIKYEPFEDKDLVIETIDNNETIDGPQVFKHQKNKIKYLGDNIWRWEDRFGNWEEYECFGFEGNRYAYLTSYGDRIGPIAKLLYDDSEPKQLIGIADRNDTQVIWYSYQDGVDGNIIITVQDMDQRTVEYEIKDLTLDHPDEKTYYGDYFTILRVKDSRENETFYEYDFINITWEGPAPSDYAAPNSNIAKPLRYAIVKEIDVKGREKIITYTGQGKVESVLDSNGHGYYYKYGYDKGDQEYYAQITDTNGKVKEVWFNRQGKTKRVRVNGREIKTVIQSRRDYIIKDANGNETTKYYDEWGNLTQIVYPDESSVSYEYDRILQKRVKKTDENG